MAEQEITVSLTETIQRLDEQLAAERRWQAEVIPLLERIVSGPTSYGHLLRSMATKLLADQPPELRSDD